ncbi:hypothetical protein [Roseivirga pacifica]|uniref:hypothetical protein n=1 Tax=Roseivirga pacifica TaxID=1267423 RepID=UPI00227AFC44|nr:hypothetical protein [Roseivirga pacifica]
MKNSLNKLFSLFLAAAMVFAVSACNDDDPAPSPDAPTVTASTSNPGNVTVDASITLNFDVTTPGGFATSSVSAQGGSATITTDMEADATSGTIAVSFSATAVGAGSVVLTVTDAEGSSDDATAVLTIDAIATTPVITVRGNITENTLWTADNIYVLDTRVTVEEGATLEIEPGTVIKGNTGQQAAATALLVARGAMIDAEGTPELPIIFTTIEDPIDPSDIAAGTYFSSEMSPENAGRWGGVIILGKAPITAKNTSDVEDLAELQIEGIPSSDPNGLYGGNEPTDNSGTLSYVSIRHGGTNIGAGNEINGLTLGGVGSGTTINNIEVVANADDGIEFFGGDVSVENVVIWNSYDDSMDTDQDWNGTVSNFIIITPRTGSAFELDGPEGTRTRGENHMFTEGVIYGGDDIDAIVDWDDDTNATLTNLYFFGITAGRIDSFGGNGAEASTNWETDLADNADGYFDGVTGNIITYGVAVADKSYGPTAADFAWTWAASSGALAELGL